MNQLEIVEMWRQESIKGSTFGSRVHLFAENYLLNKTLLIPENKKEKVYFKKTHKFLDNFLLHFDVLDVEKIIFSPSLLIAGTFDLLAQHKKSKKIYILDWKTNKKVTNSNKYHNAINGFEQYEATDMLKFKMQLNLYLYILKKENYLKRNLDIGLVILYITENGVEKINIDKLNKSEIKKLIRNC